MFSLFLFITLYNFLIFSNIFTNLSQLIESFAKPEKVHSSAMLTNNTLSKITSHSAIDKALKQLVDANGITIITVIAF